MHACGFDSIPHDLGAYFTVQQLPADQPITVRGVVRAGAMFSGGTFHSAMTAMSRARQMKEASSARAPGRAAPRGPLLARGRPASRTATRCSATGCCRCRPSTRSSSPAAARALPAYGPKFRYSHYAGTKTLRFAAGGAAAVAGARRSPRRSSRCATCCSSRIKPGDGPGREPPREVVVHASTSSARPAARTVHTRVSGGDPGYGETAKMLAESALCLALDDNPATAGQVTTAQAMGEQPHRPAAEGRDRVRGPSADPRRRTTSTQIWGWGRDIGQAVVAGTASLWAKKSIGPSGT